jgi:hypothetical protein
MGSEQVHEALARCMALIPGENDKIDVDEYAYAEDAVTALAYALRALKTGEPQEAAWAARRVYEAACYHVIHRLGIEDDMQALAHPIVQAEIARQCRDVEALLEPRPDSVELFFSLRERAKAEAALVFATSL